MAAKNSAVVGWLGNLHGVRKQRGPSLPNPQEVPSGPLLTGRRATGETSGKKRTGHYGGETDGVANFIGRRISGVNLGGFFANDTSIQTGS